jgi:hypothetical protein
MKSKVIWLLVAAFVLLVAVTRLKPARTRSTAVDTTPGSPARIEATVLGSSTAARPAAESEAERRARMLSNTANRDDFQLTADEIYLHLQANNSNAVSLVTAFEASGNKEYLKAAAETFPNDPFVQSKVLLHDVFPEDRGKWIEAFKQSAPDNAVANLLAAREAMKNGNVKTAMDEIAASGSKPYDEFVRESAQGLEEAYLLAGRPISEAKALGMAEVRLPHLAQLKGLGREFLDLAEKSSADPKSQQELLLINWQIGERLRSAPQRTALITELVGIAMQNATLNNWPAGVPFGEQPVTDVIAANNRVRKDIQSAAPIFDVWFPGAPEAEVISYMDRIKMFGERDAFAWLKERHPELAQIQPQRN